MKKTTRVSLASRNPSLVANFERAAWHTILCSQKELVNAEMLEAVFDEDDAVELFCLFLQGIVRSFQTGSGWCFGPTITATEAGAIAGMTAGGFRRVATKAGLEKVRRGTELRYRRKDVLCLLTERRFCPDDEMKLLSEGQKNGRLAKAIKVVCAAAEKKSVK